MRQVGIRELRQNASAVLRAVEAGETLEVTSRGRPVARLVPLRAESRLDQLIAEGRAAPARESLVAQVVERPPLPLLPGEPLPSEVLRQLRADER